jgi:hypothetical protein
MRISIIPTRRLRRDSETLRKTWHEASRARIRTHQIPRSKRARLRLSVIFSSPPTSFAEPSDYKHVVFGLIFLRHISLAFEARHEALLREDPLAAEDRDEYTGENIFWVPKEALWSHLQANAPQPTVRYKELPPAADRLMTLQSWDTASKGGPENDWSVCTTWIVTRRKLWYLVDVWRRRVDYPALKTAVQTLARQWNARRVLIEDAGAGACEFWLGNDRYRRSCLTQPPAIRDLLGALGPQPSTLAAQ